MVAMKIFVLSDATQRGKVYYFDVVIESLEIYELVLINNENEKNKLQRGRYFLVQNAMRADEEKTIKLFDTGKVFVTSEFNIPRQVLDDYNHPPTVGIGEVILSPRKRRLSVTGIVETVSGIIEGKSTKRREVVLADDLRVNKIKLKLWGDTTSSMQETDVGKSIQITNCVKDVYKSSHSLNTTPGTVIITDEMERNQIITIIAADRNNSGVITAFTENEEQFVLANALMEEIGMDFDEMVERLPITKQVVIMGDRALRVFRDNGDAGN